MIRKKHLRASALALFTLSFAGCNKAVNADMAYKAAINDHFKAYPACLWHEPIKFPVQVGTSDDAKTAGYDALTSKACWSAPVPRRRSSSCRSR